MGYAAGLTLEAHTEGRVGVVVHVKQAVHPVDLQAWNMGGSDNKSGNWLAFGWVPTTALRYRNETLSGPMNARPGERIAIFNTRAQTWFASARILLGSPHQQS